MHHFNILGLVLTLFKLTSHKLDYLTLSEQDSVTYLFSGKYRKYCETK